MHVRCLKPKASRAALAALFVCAVLALSYAFPSSAYGYFNEAATSFPASQDLGTYDDPIVGSQLPDGNYRVTARTTSSMCIFYTNPANAEARDSKEQAILMVNGGSMTAVFYVSKAYNYLYMGTQEQAAAATNADGTDPSQYMVGDPPEGYVPHLFTMSVPSLNTPITFASYSGGNNGNEAGKWYTRQVVFGMTTAEYQQIVMESRQQDEPEQQDPGQDSSQDQSGQQDQQANLNPNNVNTSENEGNLNQQEENQTQQSESDDQKQTAQGSEKRGVKMVIVNPDINVDIEASEAEEQSPEDGFKLTLGQVLALVVVGLLAIGIVAKIGIFKRGCDQAPRAPSDSSTGEDSVIEP